MKKSFLLALFISLSACLSAGNGVDSLFFDVRGTFHQETIEGKYDSRLQADHLNLHIFGHVADQLTYRVRHRLNRPIDKENLFSATDWLCLYWDASPKWTFTVGKTSVRVGGYEYASAPIDVYFYGLFCRRLKQTFAFSVNAEHHFRPTQHLTFQVANSPLSWGFQNCYAYSIAWKGRVAPWWQTIWSANLIEDESNRMINYLSLGNHLVFGGLTVDFDFTNRFSFRQKNYFSDYTLISKAIWNVGKWNYCAKIGYDRNSADNVDRMGRAYDVVIAPGTEYLYGGCGIEYFPLGAPTLRLHATYFRDNIYHRNNFQIGITWRFNVIQSGKKA